jgi:hypothetical protein
MCAFYTCPVVTYRRSLLYCTLKNSLQMVTDQRAGVVPVNPWPPGRQLQKIGAMMERNIHTILEPMSMPIFTEILEWSPEALRSLLTEVHKELADVRVHAFMTLSVPPFLSITWLYRPCTSADVRQIHCLCSETPW